MKESTTTGFASKTVAIHNLGCKVNAYEAEAMEELLENNGYTIVPFEQKADIYIINTCTVTNIAGRKSRQMLHRARKQNPEALVVAAGCYVHTIEEEQALDGVVDVVIGNNSKSDLLHILEENIISEVIDISATKEFEPLKLSKPREHTRVNLKVQDGCNQFCSYCIIPHVRGRVRSRAVEEVVAEVEGLAKQGCKEVVLSGIHLSSYGKDFPTGKTDLLYLIQQIHQVEGIERIRMGSLEPRIITEAFVKGLATLPKVCPHFHLSLQSGCDKTLKAMNRKYSTQEYREGVQRLRAYFDQPALTTDIIVGFPGETDADFEASYAFIDDMDFYEIHVFKFSKRKGTPAATMPDQVDGAVATLRSNRLLALNAEKKAAYENQFWGKEVELLMEDSIVIDEEVYQVGRTKEYLRVRFQSLESLHNQTISLTLDPKIHCIF